MALPLAMTMRSTTSRQTLRNYPNLAESPREPVIARRLGLNKVHDLSATEARVPRHRCAAERGQDALGHHRLEHEKQERTEKQGAGKEGHHDAAVRQGRRRSRGSDGGLTGHGCARSTEIVGHIVLRGHPLPCRNACVTLLNHMVQYMTTRLDTSFASLSDATRRGVLEQLGRADASITDLAEKFHMTLTGMKKHVGVLEQGGLVTTKKIGRVRTCQLGPRRLEEETAWLERYRQRWDERFDELDKVVEELTRKEKSDERKNRK